MTGRDRDDRKSVTMLAAAIAVVLIGVIVAGVQLWRSHGGDEHTGTDAHVHIDPIGPQESADRAAELAATMIFSWKPAEDRSAWDAMHRAMPLLGGKLEAAAKTRPTGTKPLREWSAWSRSRDHVSAAARVLDPRDEPADVATTTRRVEIRQTVLASNGSITPFETFVVEFSLARDADHHWRVVEMMRRPIGDGPR